MHLALFIPISRYHVNTIAHQVYVLRHWRPIGHWGSDGMYASKVSSRWRLFGGVVVGACNCAILLSTSDTRSWNLTRFSCFLPHVQRARAGGVPFSNIMGHFTGTGTVPRCFRDSNKGLGLCSCFDRTHHSQVQIAA